MIIEIKTTGEKILHIIPRKQPILETLQGLVGGYIEMVNIRYNGEPAQMIIDEEGKLKDKPLNPIATNIYNNPRDFIVGDVVILTGRSMLS